MEFCTPYLCSTQGNVIDHESHIQQRLGVKRHTTLIKDTPDSHRCTNISDLTRCHSDKQLAFIKQNKGISY